MEKLPKKSFKPREVADMLGCSLDNIYRLIHSGQLEAYRISGRVNLRITDIALEDFINRNKVKEKDESERGS